MTWNQVLLSEDFRRVAGDMLEQLVLSIVSDR